jgi:hypothetical protein
VDQELSQVEADQVEQPVAEETAASPAFEPKSEKKQDPWKTAFIVLIGIVLLSGVLIYSTSSRRTEPTMALQTDANGQPVQPLNPATGVEEERLAAMPADAISNANVSTIPGQLPGGDGYNPWANGGKPPPGAPVGPGGGYMTIPNGGGSQFMPPDCILQPSGIYLCPVPVNANTATVKPSPTPKGNAANANVQVAATPGAAATPAPAKPTPTPRTRNTPSPAKTPAEDQR